MGTVGSSNLDPLSLSLNLEANVIIRDRAFAQQLRTALERLMDDECRCLELSAVAAQRSGWRALLDVLAYHVTRHFPSWAGWLPAHTPKLQTVAPPAPMAQATPVCEPRPEEHKAQPVQQPAQHAAQHATASRRNVREGPVSAPPPRVRPPPNEQTEARTRAVRERLAAPVVAGAAASSWAMGRIAFLGLVVWLIADHAREIEWTEVRAAVAAYSLTTLAAAAGLVLASHFAYACYDLLARRYVGHQLATPAVLGTAFISYAFNLNLGSLVGGVGFRIRLYSKLGLDAASIGRVIAFSLVTNWSGWLLLAGASFAARQVTLPETFPIGEVGLQAIGVVMVAVPLAYVAACFFSKRREWHWRKHEFVLPSGSLALAQLALSSFNWSLIGAIVWMLLPSGLSYGSVLVTLLSAAIVGAATHVPGGLGVLEAVFVTALGARVAVPQLIAALLAYRAFYYLAPLVVAAAMHFVIEAKTRRRR